MQRKWMIAVATTFSVSLAVAGLSLADEGGPLHDIMEKVNAKSNAIKKAYRTGVSYKKAQSAGELKTNTEELIKLSKEARGLGKDPAKKAKNIKDPEKRWVELMDALTSELEKFKDVVSQPSTDQAAAKKAFTPVSQSCTNCHMDFRIDEDSF